MIAPRASRAIFVAARLAVAAAAVGLGGCSGSTTLSYGPGFRVIIHTSRPLLDIGDNIQAHSYHSELQALRDKGWTTVLRTDSSIDATTLDGGLFLRLAGGSDGPDRIYRTGRSGYATLSPEDCHDYTIRTHDRRGVLCVAYIFPTSDSNDHVLRMPLAIRVTRFALDAQHTEQRVVPFPPALREAGCFHRFGATTDDDIAVKSDCPSQDRPGAADTAQARTIRYFVAGTDAMQEIDGNRKIERDRDRDDSFDDPGHPASLNEIP